MSFIVLVIVAPEVLPGAIVLCLVAVVMKENLNENFWFWGTSMVDSSESSWIALQKALLKKPKQNPLLFSTVAVGENYMM